MENDQQDGNQGQGRLQTENLDATGELPANNNGHETAESWQEIAAESSGKRTVSSRKDEANRRNARKSTGPRTPIGKKRVSRNALRHGFYSKWLLVQHQDANESQAEYDELNAAIHEHYQPVGWLEERWVETIAVWSWRLRRVIRYETGQIARALAEHSDDLQQSREADPEPASVASSNPENGCHDGSSLPDVGRTRKRDAVRSHDKQNAEPRDRRVGEDPDAQEGSSPSSG